MGNPPGSASVALLPLLPSLLGWFVFSSLLSLYNKFIFGTRGFPYPIFMVSGGGAMRRMGGRRVRGCGGVDE